MLSARGTKTVRVQRRKSGLDFSIKGGREHGIGVVVSWIKEGGAAKELRLGDEILAVNGQPLYGLSHSQVVSKLRGAGAAVTLLVRPNQTLEDIFSNSTTSSFTHQDTSSPVTPPAEIPDTGGPPPRATPLLPQGWGQKVDHKTGRVYYENHYTTSTTWTDPRSRKPVPLSEFEWNKLAPGWDRFLDTAGDVYYVNHDTQTTHWDSPRGSRQHQLLQQLEKFIRTHKQKLKTEEQELARKRQLLLEKNALLDLHSAGSQSHDLDMEGEESQTDLLDDIMLLNEEVDNEDEHLSSRRARLQSLVTILQSTLTEVVREKEGHEEGAELAVSLAAELSKLHTLVRKLLEVVESISKLQRNKEPGTTPLHYMLQLPSLVEEEEVEEKQEWVHVLPDKLTAKTNCELRLELVLTQQTLAYGTSLQQKLHMLHTQARTHRGWEELMEQLATLDFQLLQVPYTHFSFREKLEKWLTL